MTRRELFSEAAERFAAAGIEGARTEAELLACFCFDCSRLQLKLESAEVDGTIANRFLTMMGERLGGRPLQYIMGTARFCDMDFYVDERVLIPRPETEELVAYALEWMKGAGPRSQSPCAEACGLQVPGDAGPRSQSPCPEAGGLQVLDLCTGSGAIACAMARGGAAGAAVTATDLSPDALAVAELNASRLGLSVEFLEGDLWSAVPGRRFHLIATNPPYIPAGVIAGLQPEVRGFEPLMALDGGPDGLDLIRRIIDGLPDHLLPGGLFLMEIGDDQGAALKELLPGCEIIRDINGLDRIVRWQRPE